MKCVKKIRKINTIEGITCCGRVEKEGNYLAWAQSLSFSPLQNVIHFLKFKQHNNGGSKWVRGKGKETEGSSVAFLKCLP